MPTRSLELTAGLCARCMHARTVQNPRGSVFILCELSFSNPQFAKYPRLPILVCEGFAEDTAHKATPASSS